MSTKEREILKQYGLKDILISKLNDLQVREIVAFSMDHIQSSNLQNMLLQLVSMEVSGKQGVAYLAHNGIALPMQLRSLSKEQIDEIIGDYGIHRDIALAIKAVKDKIIDNQQDHLVSHGGDPDISTYITDEEDNMDQFHFL